MTRHLAKLARTLINSGLESDPGEAMKKAREMLKIKDPEPDKNRLPKIEDIEAAGKTNELRDGSLKDLVEEDAEMIYGKQPSGKQR